MQQISNDVQQQQQSAGMFGIIRPGKFQFFVFFPDQQIKLVRKPFFHTFLVFIKGNMPTAPPMMSPQQRLDILKRPEAQVLIQSNV